MTKDPDIPRQMRVSCYNVKDGCSHTVSYMVEKLSGNIVKEAYAKGELQSLRLLESWLDRHVPETMAELRRRANDKEEG